MAERRIILKNTETGQELTMPVTPSSYPMAAGRAVERLDMAQTGQIALPGLVSLFDQTLEVMLPAQLYPFCTSGAVADPDYYLELLTAWSQAGQVCRYIVSGTGINSPVLLGPVEYGEEDGSNDVYVKIPLYEYRYLEEAQVETATQNSGRASETASQPATADSYTVVSGDSLWAICKRFYGDGSLAYKLATANNISNPNLIYPGQVLTMPDAATLATLAATTTSSTTSGSSSSGSSTSSSSASSSEAARELARATVRQTLSMTPTAESMVAQLSMIRNIGG